MTNTPEEIQKSYLGLLTTIFGVSHTMPEGSVNLPKRTMTQEEFDDLMELRAEMHKDCQEVCCVPEAPTAEVIDIFTRKAI
jgi:FAD synthase